MSNRHASASVLLDLFGIGFATNRDEIAERFRDGVQRDIAAHLAAGDTIYYCGTGDDADRLFMRTPDGRRFEYHVLENGVEEIVDELP